MNGYSFNEMRRKFMEVELASDIVVHVYMPTVELADVYAYMIESANVLANEDASQEEIDKAYEVFYRCFARIVSYNMEVKTFTVEYLRDELGIGPFLILDFIRNYSEFFTSELNRKN